MSQQQATVYPTSKDQLYKDDQNDGLYDKQLSSQVQIQNNNNAKQVEQPEQVEQVGFFQMFRYASGGDKFLCWVGGLAAVINGLTLPAFCVVFGKLIDSFGEDMDEMVEQTFDMFLYLLYIGIGSFLLSYLQMFAYISTGERQCIALRKAYFRAILLQDIEWFDQEDPNKLATKISTETFAVQGAIGEKVPTFVMTIATVIGGFVVAYLFGWELALICTAFLPILAFAAFMFTYILQNSELKVSGNYQKASGRAEQALAGIKTVKSLNGQAHEQSFYQKTLQIAYDTAFKWGILIGICLGFMWFTVFLDFAVGLFFGSIFIREEYMNDLENRPYTSGDVILVFFAMMMGSFSLGQATPCLKNFSLGRSAAFQIFKVIDAKPKISPSLNKGTKPSSFNGSITFQNVEFSYPVKQDQKILKSISLNIKPGQKTALVGESGCGKSTIMQLIERFYDASSGEVLVDGHNIKDLHLGWYRQHVGYVGQEPVLFAGTIRENLQYGKKDATEQDMITVLKQANAWDFIEKLDNGIDTIVGNMGSQLSGGQKQRICIARALLKNPPILLLDEATSALDRTNEKSIQKTLDEVSKNRTTIVIAHRLSTVENSDSILVIDQGELIEQGSHQSLIQQQGKYFALSQNQKKQEEEEEAENQLKQQGLQHVQELKNLSEVKNQSKMLELNQNQISVQALDAKQPKEQQLIDQAHVKTEDEKKLDNASRLQLEKKKQAQKQKEEEQEKKMLGSKLFALNKEERPYMFMGGIFSFISGCCFPVSAIFLAHLLFVLGSFYNYADVDDFKRDVGLDCLGMFIVGIVSFVSNLLQFASWKKVGEGLTLKLRQKGFEKITNMRGDWFDLPENSPGTLSSRLGSDSQIVNTITSTVLNVNISSFGALVSGLVIGFIYDWRTTLVALGCFPFMAVAGALQAQFVQGFSEQTDSGYKDSGNLVQESVINMRTVNSFGNENTIQSTYETRLEGPAKIISSKATKVGVAFGLSQFVMFLMYGVIYYVGSLFVRDYGVEYQDMFTAVFAIMNAAMSAGNNNAFMGDIGAAYNAAKNIFKILESKDEIQQHEDEVFNIITDFSNFKGEIEFKDVVFKYPTRENYVLTGVSFKVKAGQKCALVGPSGCGKSTIMQILLRFYEIESGEIYIDGIDYKRYEIKGLRAQYGVVSQEPILFTGTIEENIRYNTQNCTLDDIKKAAQKANALSFIEGNQMEVQPNQIDLKDVGSGFDRQVGPKGSFLSGGQKQRIAIARAILKNPKVLFLDEATSALDNKNEKIVQESLDQIMQNKTTLSIAHRISTIKDSDQIFVFEAGQIVEQGTYDQLRAKKGFFYRLENGDHH